MDEHILAVEIGGELSCVGGAARLRYNYRENILAATLLCWRAAQRERYA
jgi:hypothetical protein